MIIMIGADETRKRFAADAPENGSKNCLEGQDDCPVYYSLITSQP